MVSQIFTFVCLYLAGTFHRFFELAESKIGSRPDIFSIDKEYNERETETQESAKIDFTSKEAIKASLGGVLSIVVEPHLGAEQKDQIREYDEKLDALLALGEIVPGATDMVNEQVKQMSEGQLDVYELDDYMHKILGKED